jgi:organic radical activating enzyme
MIKNIKTQKGAFIFSSASCHLNCKYCYIPKTDLMNGLNEEVRKTLDGKKNIENLKYFYGKRLEHLTLAGAEPTLNLDAFGKNIHTLLKFFPNLEKIFLTTSFLTDPFLILNFIRKLTELNRKIDFICTISLDGPFFITDKNRKKGASQSIINNYFRILKDVNKIDLKKTNLIFKFRPTLTLENINFFNENTVKLKEYFYFFEDIFQRFKKENINKKNNLFLDSTHFLALPGKYTSADGKTLKIFFENLRNLAKKNNKKRYWKHAGLSLNKYTLRLNQLFKNQTKLFSMSPSFTCSAGNTAWGIGIKNDLQICLATFFLQDEKYIESVLSQKNIDNWHISAFKKKTIEMAKNKYTVKIKDENNCTRLAYIMRNYHDFTRFKNSYIIAMIKELALAGQADKEFLEDDDLCFIFALFINSALSCPSENLLNTGVIHFAPVSMIRLFGNGAFLEVLKDYNENLSKSSR